MNNLGNDRTINIVLPPFEMIICKFKALFLSFLSVLHDGYYCSCQIFGLLHCI